MGNRTKLYTETTFMIHGLFGRDLRHIKDRAFLGTSDISGVVRLGSIDFILDFSPCPPLIYAISHRSF